MATLTIDTPNISRFDVVEYIKKLRNAGASQELAEVQAQEIEHIISDVLTQSKQEIMAVINSKELATKGDLREIELRLQKAIAEGDLSLRTDIAKTSNKTILWIIGILSGYGVFFLGILAKGFHWL